LPSGHSPRPATRMSAMRSCHGITLVELLIGVALMGTLLGLAVPSYFAIVDEGRATRAANQLHAMLSLARNRAISVGHRVVLCRSSNQNECSFSGAWSAGAILFDDANRNSVRDNGEWIVATLDRSDVAPYHVVGPRDRRVIGFNPDGRSAGTNIALRICDPNLATRRLVIVSVSGRPRTSRDVASAPRCGTDPST